MSWSVWERERRGGGGGGGCGREKRKHHGNVIQTLLNLSKVFIFDQPQSTTKTAVNKEKKIENCKRIITFGDMETERNAPMQATQIHEAGDDVVSWAISPRVHPYFKHFAFFFLISSGSYHIYLRAQQNEHHIWQDEALMAAFQKR